MVLVLQITYALSFLDRALLSLLVEPIRADLALSDIQVSLLLGLAFAVLNATLGLPLGMIADRINRPRLLAACAAVWCLATAASGLARGFVPLFVARVIVGAGEAGLGPTAPALISDRFIGPRRSVAISIYQMASSIGAGLALIGGGAVLALASGWSTHTGFAPWRVVFITVGTVGLAVPLLLLTLSDPRTGAAKREELNWRAVLPFIGSHRSLLARHFGGFALFTALSYGVANWIPAFLERRFGWSEAVIGTRYGVAVLLAGMPGVLAGGLFTATLRRHGRTDAAAIAMALGAAGAGLFGALAPLASTGWTALAVYGVAIFWLSFPTGVSVALVQDIAPPAFRARLSALYYVLTTLIGVPLGPLLVALANERLFGGGKGLGPALALDSGVLGCAAAMLLWSCRAPLHQALSR